MGVVQGVGFRPFVKTLADRWSLCGEVTNIGSGVLIEIEVSGQEQVDAFVAAVRANAPPVARILSVNSQAVDAIRAMTGFEIGPSETGAPGFTLVPPDLATCVDCLREIGNPADRRFGYAFTNCTNCGPRYSIIHGLPYDRRNITMEPFRMCVECTAEYVNPQDRRYHAEANACPVCGPRLSDSIETITSALANGEIVALKSLGGFQLACCAFATAAVEKLRSRKKRGNKPFAVMMANVETVRRHCFAGPEEIVLLSGRAAPIVLLRLRQPLEMAAGIAPGLSEAGVMLPYTPMHQLLFGGPLSCLVMTSGNSSEEPIAISNGEAQDRLRGLADRVITHDRDICTRVDDSVVRYHAGSLRILRRSRGYAPSPIDLGREAGEVLACGGELKNTFCITKGRYAILSQHIGDLENYETLEFYEEALRNLQSMYRSKPRLIAHDLHPDYLTSRWAERQSLPKLPVQHHHAHIVSCMAENGIQDRVIGVAFDGTGYGTDGQIWGGEFLLCEFTGFQRIAHLRPVPLVGGDRAMREGFRMAAAYLFDAFGPDYLRLPLPSQIASLPRAFDQVLHQPSLMTSSCGRLFDAVASLAGVCQINTYEGEAAMLLESAIGGSSVEAYEFTLDRGGSIDTRPMFRRIVSELAAGHSAVHISDRFHTTISDMVSSTCRVIRDASGVNKVCLSGGVFQNLTLVDRTARVLAVAGFEVFTHSLVPPNDGGLALGQAAIATAILEREGA